MKILTNNNLNIGVAVSGGIDSMALLDCYMKAEQKIVVINIEHGLRGETSVLDSKFVKEYCEKNGIECLSFTIDTKKEAKKNKESIELTARRLRYEIFDNLLKEKKVDRIALAHHSNDNTETILMRLFRGTGIKGLCGITDRDKYIHPFIENTREEIKEYVDQNNIPYVEDETNHSNLYNRNYVRNKIIPLIKKRFGDIESIFTRLSVNAMEVQDYLSSQIVKYRKKGDKYYLDDIFAQHKLIQKYSISKVLNDMGLTQNIETRHFDYIMSLVKKPLNTMINLPYNIICVRTKDGVVFCHQRDYSTYSSQFYVEKVYKYAGNRYSFVKGDKMVERISFDLDKTPLDCVIRTRIEGDKFKNVNGKSKLLSDYLNSLKMSVLEKQRLLVLAKDSEVFAILGVETSDKVKIDENTKNIIHIIKEK